MKNKIDNIFKTHFSDIGKGVKKEQLQAVIQLMEGKNTLCLMPTGSGKSLIYWLAGKALEGITIVIFPLTALMDEQANKLSKHNCKVITLHSGISSKKQYDELISLYSGDKPDFIFVSPERLATDGFLEFVLKSIKDKIKLVVIDEIHCISQWGLDFRPFYKEIPYFLDNVFDNQKPVVLGLTATLNPKDKEVICKDFSIPEKHIVKSKYLLRYNINLQVIKVASEDEKDEKFWDTIEKHKDEKILVYLDRISGKRSTEELCQLAISKGYKSDFFHSERTSDEKMQIIENFKNNKITLLFATSAFGMGIDIPDIRGIIHYLPTESIEQYYQQIGRAGRDRKSSWAKLFYSDKNLQVRRTYFIDKSFPTVENINKAFEVLSDNKIGKKTFNYFDEDNAQSAFHYLLRSELVEIICKGIQRINDFENKNPLPEFENYLSTTKTGLLLGLTKKLNISEQEIIQNIYSWLASKKIKTKTSPTKCLVVNSHFDKIPDNKVEEILKDIEEKKKYKYQNFDEFIDLLNEYKNYTQFHQSIGRYLGIDEFELGKIHQTLSGDMVRSKSEVIIANILFERNIPFKYEQELISTDGQMFSPDFTINWNGKIYYWEHLGLIDNEEYMNNWEIKKNWYNHFFPNQLVISEESAVLSKTAEGIVNEIFS